jgi:hypothetical protein
MTREMLKFNTVEVAFKNIKTATGVSNTSELVRKFLNKENAYGELLGKIADNERNIADLKSEHEELVRDRRKLETEQDELNSNRAESKDLQREEKAFHLMAEKAGNCKLLTERLALWSTKSIKKFNSLDNAHEEVEVKTDPHESLAQLKGYLERLSRSIEEVTIVEDKPVDAKVSMGGSNLRIQLNPKDEHVEQNKNQCTPFTMQSTKEIS